MSPRALSTRPIRRRLRAAGWAVAIGLSAWASWTVGHPAPPVVHSAVPDALPRPPTAAERAQVELQAESLAAAIAAAEARKGSPLAVTELEGTGPDGQPWLPAGLPDNPLTPAVAWAHPHCVGQPTPTPAPDWLVCESEGSLRAGGLTAPSRWSYRLPGSGKE